MAFRPACQSDVGAGSSLFHPSVLVLPVFDVPTPVCTSITVETSKKRSFWIGQQPR